MKHYIIAKFNNKIGDKAAALHRIKEIFAQAPSINGVHGVQVFSCCVARDNRYDVMIVLDMNQAALLQYDASEMHRRWKAEFSDKLEKKAIFDHE